MPARPDSARELHVAANDLVRYLERKAATDKKTAADSRLVKLLRAVESACDKADEEGW
jgi:hypothetical protein